jgi:mono/diheme cytochrome c family protein
LVAALAAGGCGSTGLPEAGDATRGKELFVQGCAQCHVLADAGTKGVIGPNLDDAFRQARADGLGETTIASVIRTQIAYPVEEPSTGSPGMPADIYTGEDADAVTDYVASVAGLPVRGGSAAPSGGGGEGEDGGDGDEGDGGEEAADGEAIFAEAGCGGCHTLEAAGTSGTVGPNLDDSKPSKELAVDRITNGRGAMPPFKDSYSAAQIEAVADYVVGNAGK